MLEFPRVLLQQRVHQPPKQSWRRCSNLLGFTSKNENIDAARAATAEAEREKLLNLLCFTRANVVLTQKLEKVLNFVLYQYKSRNNDADAGGAGAQLAAARLDVC